MRTHRMLIVWGLSALMGAATAGLSCSGGDDAGGTGGAGGSGGACGFPDCIGNLAKACVPSGACMSEGSGAMINICFANGVKILTSAGMAGANTRITKTDGSTCYSIETTVDLMSMPPGVKYVYKDASGKEVATASVDTSGSKLKVTCDGKTTEVDTTCGMSGMGGAGGSGGMCAMGMCK